MKGPSGRSGVYNHRYRWFRNRGEDGLAAEVKKQAELAIEEADVIIMVVDARKVWFRKTRLLPKY